MHGFIVLAYLTRVAIFRTAVALVPDGRCQLGIHAEITTEDGKKIAIAADGVAIPEAGSPVFQLRENVTLTTNHPEYSWMNTIQVWAPGTVDLSKGEIHVKGYTF